MRLVRARIPGMDATESLFPGYSPGDPNTPAMRVRNLLGLAGVINETRLIFDDPPSLVCAGRGSPGRLPRLLPI